MLALDQYPHKVDPFQHQLDDLETSTEEVGWAWLWEQGTGKSKALIDNACLLYDAGEIDGVLLIALPGAYRTWEKVGLPKLMPDRWYRQLHVCTFQSSKAKTQWQQRLAADNRAHQGFPWLVMSYDGMMTEGGRDAAWEFLKRRRCLFALDESWAIKTPSAKRTQRFCRASEWAPYRRILNGTPVTNEGPCDLYSQVRFLYPRFWKARGIDDFQAFKGEYCEIETGFKRVGKGRDSKLKEYKYIAGYRNLDRLRSEVAKISSRVLKSEALDLPPKLYSQQYFGMAPEQSRVYSKLRDEYMVELENGELITAEMVMTRLLRLQQVSCGYVPDDDGDLHSFKKNPRLDALVESCEPLGHQAIVWARFRQDIDRITDALGDRAVRFDGRLNEDDRERSREAFVRGDAQFFVANQAVGGASLDLTQAKTEFYYSNTFSVLHRSQSEDRAHRIGQDQPVNIVDIVAQGSVDQHILGSLQRNFDIASEITGDHLRQWLTAA